MNYRRLRGTLGALAGLLLLLRAAGVLADVTPVNSWVFDQEHIDHQTVKPTVGKDSATITGPVRIEPAPQFGSLALDGATVSIEVADDYKKVAVPHRALTAEAWVRIDKPQEWGGIVGIFQDNGAYEKGWVLGFQGMKFTFGMKAKAGPNTFTFVTPDKPFQRGLWYHVVGTFNGREQHLYVNGKLSASAPFQKGEIDYPPAAFYQIGAYRDQDEFFRMAGAIHDVHIYDRALSPPEVESRYRAQASHLPPPTSLRLASLFTNHAVLQRDQRLPVWGWAKPEDEITVELNGATAKTKADKDGKWKTTLPPQAAGGPHKLIVTGAKDRVEVEDVLIGEVWVCSGQSNMQFGVNGSEGAAQVMPTAKLPGMRFFTVSNVMTSQPEPDCDAGWDVCTPQTVPTFSAVGFYFGRELHQELNVPIGLINASWGGSVCEAWMSRESLAADPDFAPILDRAKSNPWNGTGMYNAMIHPLIPYGIRGVIWYQGESNCLRAEQYRKLFPALIRDWRSRWGEGDFPFYYVQLAPFARHKLEWPELWEAQRMTLSVPNTGMAVITDVGNVGNIHPPKKLEVGHRLALWALAKTYGRKDVVYSGPLYKSAQVEGNKIRIGFDHVEGGLASRDGKPLSWFTIAGEDKVFHPAVAEIEKDSIVVSSPEVPAPRQVRFGWDCVAEPNLMNKAGLPASPFRTDDWPGVTAGKK